MSRRKGRLLLGIAALLLFISVSCAPAGHLAGFSSAQTRKVEPNNSSAGGSEVEHWKTYTWGGFNFRYPPGWQVEPQYYRTPPQEQAGKPASVVGLTISPMGEPRVASRLISIGGRQTDCSDVHCKCFTIYEPEYTCNPDAETSKTFDLLLTTIKDDNTDSAFLVTFPAAEDRLRPNTRYTIRWRTKSNLRIHQVSLAVHDTSRYWRDGLVLDAKEVLNTGTYDWLVPNSIESRGPYLVEISHVKRVKAVPPSFSAGHIYAGHSNPFYIY